MRGRATHPPLLTLHLRAHADSSAIERVRSLSAVRRHPNGQGGEAARDPKNGSIASSFYVANPKSGHGLVFSPRGDLLLQYGFGPNIKLTKAVNGAHANTLKGSTGNIRFAAFSNDGKYIMAASDGEGTEAGGTLG